VVAHPKPGRFALVVHPSRPIEDALDPLERWADQYGMELVQIPVVGGGQRDAAPAGELESGDLVIALGGDGTVLSALRAAAPKDAPVLGVSCGSLGALAAVPADQVADALDRIMSGDWTGRRLPALAIHPVDAPGEWAVNDFVVNRRGSGQVVTDLYVEEELYVRAAGDGLIVATPLGSSAYSMAAGGPILVWSTEAIVCTPVAMHGGSAPPLVVPAAHKVRVVVHPSYAGFDIEIDGHAQGLDAVEYEISLHQEKVRLVSFEELGLGIASLRARRLVTDSPRMLARDDRAARA
jgi:NAD+ kinase